MSSRVSGMLGGWCCFSSFRGFFFPFALLGCYEIILFPTSKFDGCVGSMDDSSDTMHLDKAMAVMEYISRNIDTRPCWHCNIHPAQTASERNVFFLSRFHLLLLQSVSYSIPTTYCIFDAHPMTPDLRTLPTIPRTTPTVTIPPRQTGIS